MAKGNLAARLREWFDRHLDENQPRWFDVQIRDPEYWQAWLENKKRLGKVDPDATVNPIILPRRIRFILSLCAKGCFAMIVGVTAAFALASLWNRNPFLGLLASILSGYWAFSKVRSQWRAGRRIRPVILALAVLIGSFVVWGAYLQDRQHTRRPVAPTQVRGPNKTRSALARQFHYRAA
ncbi:MAG TPA: hypothetical protein VG206_19995 [Terriglobia bacterium]|nr:hypothetical protein [Terriglobia bacterium]